MQGTGQTALVLYNLYGPCLALPRETTMMQRYPAYKNSGFDWLKEVPEHWELKSIRAITKVKTERNKPDLPLLSVYRDYGVIYKDSRDDNHNRAGMDLSNYKVVAPNDLVINKMKTWQGSLGVSQYEGIVSPAYIVCDLDDSINGLYLNYLLRCRFYVHAYNRISYGIRVDQWDMHYQDFKQLPVFLPSPEEQTAIVVFLEEQTAVINQFLTNKRRLIALLEEQKQVVINTAVTQGLDTAVARKPSGIDWLGDIPANWQGIKLKHLSKFIQTGPFGSQLHAHDYVDNGMPVINPIHLQNGRIVPDWSITVDNETLTRLERHQLEIGDVILARRGELGRCAVVDSESAGWLCGTGSMNLRPRSDQVFSPYLAQIIQSEKVKTWLTTESVGSTMDNLNGSILGNLKVPVPPIQEQQQIIYLCREREAEINTAIERTQREIELIEEYRTTLIATAVTGKIDVRPLE